MIIESRRDARIIEARRDIQDDRIPKGCQDYRLGYAYALNPEGVT